MSAPDGLSLAASPAGRGFRLEAAQFLPASRERVFAFFSDAFRLETITPPWLEFRVLTPAPIAVSAGTLIDYRLKLHRIPVRWRSRIAVWEPASRFVDEQVCGPYRRWHHEHFFEAVDGGTLCRDVVDYDVPGGGLVDFLFVRRDLRRIFSYRRRRLSEFFPG